MTPLYLAILLQWHKQYPCTDFNLERFQLLVKFGLWLFQVFAQYISSDTSVNTCCMFSLLLSSWSSMCQFVKSASQSTSTSQATEIPTLLLASFRLGSVSVFLFCETWNVVRNVPSLSRWCKNHLNMRKTIVNSPNCINQMLIGFKVDVIEYIQCQYNHIINIILHFKMQHRPCNTARWIVSFVPILKEKQ